MMYEGGARWAIIALLQCMLVLPGNEAAVIVSVRLMTYSNPQNLDINGACCDPGCARCNYFFELCVAETRHACVISGTTDRWNNINDIVFSTGALGGNLQNPMIATRPSWKGTLQVRVVVRDYDYMTTADLVDRFSLSRQLVPEAGMLPQVWTETQLTGKSSSMVIRYSVQCTRDYYGPNCTTHCIPRDGTSGHYTCDLKTGGRVCRPGWHGPQCRVYCIPRDDDVNGHFTCQTGTGLKICLANWYGVLCKTYCAPINNSDAGYNCDVTGSRVCLPGWYPREQCETLCIPHNDSTASYTCDSQTGSKTCLSGWSGPECDCRPRLDASAGYTCNETTGQKICYPGWYGRNCNVACFPRNDSTGHYNCNADTGAKECLESWIGEQCDVYCVPDNQTHSCLANGTRKCQQHWYGQQCHVFCQPRPIQYTCQSTTGAKVCSQGWYGEDCSTFCKSRDSDWFGHFDCDRNGSRVCHMYWHGPECKAYCKPHRNSTLGYYRCDDHGNPVCERDWYGTKCTVYCRPRDDEEGHYSCGAVDGRRVCLEDWYGENCTVHCVADKEGHFTCDGKTGQRVCLPGWGGQDCQQALPTTLPSEVPTSPPLTGKSSNQSSEGMFGDMELALILGGFILFIVLTTVTAVIVSSRRQSRSAARQFEYKRQTNSPDLSRTDPSSSPVELHIPTPQPAPILKASKKGAESSIKNLLAEYDDLEAQKSINENVYITLKEVSWDDEGSRRVDNSLVMYNNPLFVEARKKGAKKKESRVDPKTGLRDNSDWVDIFNSYRDDSC
ncbi:protein draper [Nematostella vectensis]|uniref:protein draper n=1 Tax=Nematostella vectensis TaxID=45351 RepID=UPI002077103B|nr:protein draper [Nematostella vectensis]